MNTCVICRGGSPCFKCQLTILQKENTRLNLELKYWRNESSPVLVLKKDYSKNFHLTTVYQPIVYNPVDLTPYRFLTITFDPKKFGQYNNNNDERNYIFYTLDKSIRDCLINRLTGCFEYQVNGTTHAHILITTDKTDKQVEQYFRPYYTDDKRNIYAIKCVPAKFPNVETYIKKESNEYYRYDPHADYGIDDGIDVPPISAPPKEQPIIDKDKRILVYRNEIKNLERLIATLEGRKNISPLEPKSKNKIISKKSVSASL